MFLETKIRKELHIHIEMNLKIFCICNQLYIVHNCESVNKLSVKKKAIVDAKRQLNI